MAKIIVGSASFVVVRIKEGGIIAGAADITKMTASKTIQTVMVLEGKEVKIMLEKIKQAVILANRLFENPNDEESKRLLRKLYDGCTQDEGEKLNSLGIHPEVAPKLKELLNAKMMGGR